MHDTKGRQFHKDMAKDTVTEKSTMIYVSTTVLNYETTSNGPIYKRFSKSPALSLEDLYL